MMTALFLCAALVLAFAPVFVSENAFAAEGGSDYRIVFNDGKNDAALLYYNIPLAPDDYSNGDKVTVTDHGKSTTFTYSFNGFYDKNDKSLAEHGYGIYYTWLEDYDFYGADDPGDHIGKKYSFVYFLYRADENGDPVSEEVLAYTDPIVLTSADDHIETTINGIRYFAEYDQYEGSVIILTDNEHNGTLKIPANVKIDGKFYPVRRIDPSVFARQPGITSLKLPDCIDYIGDYAFVSTGLKSVNIPDNIHEIGDYAFGYNVEYNEETYASRSALDI